MVETGFRIDFDARDARVYFLFGYQVIDSMSIGEFKTLFGVEEVRRLIHGDALLARGQSGATAYRTDGNDRVTRQPA